MSLSLPHQSVTATWHDDSLTRDNFFDFFLKLKKNNNKKKIQKT